MLMFVRCAGLIALASLSGISQAGDPLPGSIPFELRRHFMVVDANLPGKKEPMKLIFDTGIQLTMLDIKLVKELGLPLLQEVPTTDSSGSSTKMGIYKLGSVSVAGKEVKDVVCGAIDMDPLRRHSGAPVVGILGDNFMRPFCISIDYRAKALRLDSSSRSVSGGFTVKAPKRPPFNPFAVPISVAGNELEGIIDTGAYDIGLPSELLKKLGLASSEFIESKGAMAGGLIGAGGKDLLVRVPDIKVGTLTMPKYPAGSVENKKALLGYRFLSQFRLTIDNLKDTVTFVPYADAAFPTNVFHTGLALAQESDKTVLVKGLWIGSPSDKAGVKVGDKVLEINGKPAASYSQAEISELNTNPKVLEIRLVIDRDGTKVEATVVKAYLFP